MAWQDDDDNRKDRKDKDPWTGNDNPNGPPDLEQAIRRLFKSLKKPVPSDEGPKFNQNGKIKSKIIGNDSQFFAFFGLILIVVFALWVLSGIFIVAPSQNAVILRFGKFHRTVGPGPHWIPRFIDERYILSVEDIMDHQYNAEMLTRDENIVSVGVAIQYRIGNSQNYLFKVVNPIESLTQVTTSVLRQVIGDKALDEVLNYGQARVDKEITTTISNDIKVAVSELLESYQTGLIVTDVAIQFIKPPQAVIEAFDDVIIAGEDKVRYQSEAEADAQKLVLEAQGIAQRYTEEAKAIASNYVANAKGKTAEFLGELPQYKKTPTITRERLYLETMTTILGNNPKLFITAQENNNLLYLPLDKFLEKSSAQLKNQATVEANSNANAANNFPSERAVDLVAPTRQNIRMTRDLDGRG